MAEVALLAGDRTNDSKMNAAKNPEMTNIVFTGWLFSSVKVVKHPVHPVADEQEACDLHQLSLRIGPIQRRHKSSGLCCTVNGCFNYLAIGSNR
jgi:hypothetical protein